MLAKRLPVFLMIAAFIFGVLDKAFFYSRLPTRMASHFDLQGTPNGWRTKEQFVTLSIGALGFLAMVSALAIFTIRSASAELLNLPDKKYWLAPERQAETRDAISSWTCSFMALTMWLLAFIFHDAMADNVPQPPRPLAIWWMVGGYFAILIVFIVRLVIRFRQPKLPPI